MPFKYLMEQVLSFAVNYDDVSACVGDRFSAQQHCNLKGLIGKPLPF